MGADGEEVGIPTGVLLEDLEDLGQAADDRLGEMTILLLGRGHELDKRRRLKTCLEDDQGVGAQILVMEDYPDQDDEDPGDKWDRLVATEEPGDYIILVPDEGPMGGVAPEYGRVRERLRDATRHHVHFFWPEGIDTREVLDPYMGTMAGKAHAQPYADEDELCEMTALLIEKLALLDVTDGRP